jgi:F0F1-type ATP synthase membrane subunit b/b'
MVWEDNWVKSEKIISSTKNAISHRKKRREGIKCIKKQIIDNSIKKIIKEIREKVSKIVKEIVKKLIKKVIAKVSNKITKKVS